MPGVWLEGLRLIIADAPARDMNDRIPGLPYGVLGLPQPATEAMLTRQLARFGGRIERGVSLEALSQDADSVTATLVDADGRRETASFRYVVGCDGAHSAVRRLLGIAFEGDAFPMGFMLGDVRLAWPAGQELPRGMALRVLRPKLDDAPDMLIAIPLPERDRYRVSMVAPPELAGPEDGHGIQSERPVPGIGTLQAVVDALLPAPAPARGPALGLGVQDLDAARGQLSPGPRLPRRRRRPHPPADRRPGHEHRHPGRLQSRLEAGAGGCRRRTGRPPRFLRRRASPGRCRRAAADGRRQHESRPRDRRGPTR